MTEHLISTAACLAPCPRCGHPTLRALAGGCPVTADPQPLSPDAELTALLAKRSTYDALAAGWPQRMFLEWRSLGRIKAPRIHPVVATHICKPPVVSQPPQELILSVSVPLPDDPPF